MFDRGLLIGIGLLVALLLLNAGLMYQNTQQLYDSADRVTHAHQVLDALDAVLSSATDAETGQRGFVITGDPKYLKPYTEAVAAVDGHVNELNRLVSDARNADPEQQGQIPVLKERLAAKLKELDETIQLRKDEGFDAAKQVVLTDQGKDEMDALRTAVKSMEDHERELLKERAGIAQAKYHRAILTGVLTALLGLAAVGAFVYLLQRHLQARAQDAAAIFEQREKFRTTLASIGDGVITTDTAGRVTFMNPVAQALVGRSLQDANGMTLTEVFNIVNEHTRETVDNPALRALAEGAIVGLANHTLLISTSGAETPIDDSAAPIRSEQGEVSGAVLVFRDVSERRRTEKRIHESEEQFHTLADSIPQLAWMAQPDGKIFWFNKRWYEYTGTEPGEMEGSGWQARYEPVELPGLLETYQAALGRRESWEGVFSLRRHDGVMRRHLSRAVPLLDDEGKVVRWFGTHTDITDRLQMEETLKLADRQKDQFLAMLAHELRNPLAPIRNALELLTPETDAETAQWAKQLMLRQVQHIVRLVDDLLDVSRVMRGKIQLRKEPVEVSSAIRHAVEEAKPVIDGQEQELTISIPSEPIWVQADPNRLSQIVSNLLTNAAKYTDKKGKIWLEVQQNDDQVEIAVRDTGIGIASDMQERIFEPFVQATNTLDRSRGGLGIGLALVRSLVELHDGSVRVRSQGLGQGSEFLVRLSTIEHSNNDEPTEWKPTPVPIRKILVVDDNHGAAETLARLLKMLWGHSVEVAHDGPSTLSKAEQFQPDMVLLDIGLPGMNGYEVARSLREQPGLRTVFLAALTGYGQDEDRRRSHEAGFDEHLVKPISVVALQQLFAHAKLVHSNNSGH
jgi:PAS domain S-box-containing protein